MKKMIQLIRYTVGTATCCAADKNNTTAVKRNAFWVAFNLVSDFPLGFGKKP